MDFFPSLLLGYSTDFYYIVIYICFCYVAGIHRCTTYDYSLNTFVVYFTVTECCPFCWLSIERQVKLLDARFGSDEVLHEKELPHCSEKREEKMNRRAIWIRRHLLFFEVN